MKPLTSLLLMLAIAMNGYSQTTTSVANNAKTTLSNPVFKESLNKSMNTVTFIRNQGQYENPDVLYTFNTLQAQMVIFKDRLRLISLSKKEEKNLSDKHTVDIRFIGADKLNPIPVVNEDGPVYNYFVGANIASNIKPASEVRFENVYKGVALRLYSDKNGSLEFDWMVNNAADYKKINRSRHLPTPVLID